MNSNSSVRWRRRKKSYIIRRVAVDLRCFELPPASNRRPHIKKDSIVDSDRHEYSVCVPYGFRRSLYSISPTIRALYSHRHLFSFVLVRDPRKSNLNAKEWLRLESLHSMNCFERYRTRVSAVGPVENHLTCRVSTSSRTDRTKDESLIESSRSGRTIIGTSLVREISCSSFGLSVEVSSPFRFELYRRTCNKFGIAMGDQYKLMKRGTGREWLEVLDKRIFDELFKILLGIKN